MPFCVRIWISVGLLIVATSGPTLAQSPPPPNPGCVLRVGWNEWPPYIFRSTDGILDGFDVRFLRALAAEIDCDLDWQERPWARILVEIRRGNLDLAPWAVRTQERVAFAFFSRPYINEAIMLIGLAPSLPATRPQSFAELAASRLVFGAELGAVYSEAYKTLLDAGAFGDRIQLVPDLRLLMPLLVRGRVDAILSPIIAARHAAAAHGEADNIVVLSVLSDESTDEEEGASFMFSRASVPESVVLRFDDVLAQMLFDGRYDAILRPYDPKLNTKPKAAAQ